MAYVPIAILWALAGVGLWFVLWKILFAANAIRERRAERRFARLAKQLSDDPGEKSYTLRRARRQSVSPVKSLAGVQMSTGDDSSIPWRHGFRGLLRVILEAVELIVE